MCRILVFILCAVAVTDVFPKEIPRLKRQTFELANRWIWGYADETPVPQKTTSLMPLLTSVEVPGSKVIVKSSTHMKFTSEPPTFTTTMTVSPFTPRIEVDQVQAKGTSPLKPLTETNDISASAEPVLIKAVTAPPAEIRLLNGTTPTEDKETTTLATVSTTPVGFCDRGVKPDFSAPGRRISEEQCMGYVWEMKNRKREVDLKPYCGFRFWELTDLYYVIGGRTVEHGEFPHMGAIGWKAAIGTWVFKCGSTLISPNFVLTAAHCSKASSKDSSIADPVPKIVRLGDKRITDKQGFPNSNQYKYPTDGNIIKIIVHSQYKPPLKYNDIALIELEKPVEFTKLIQPACLWDSHSMGDPGHEATLTGWGVIETGALSVEAAPELMAATVDILDSQECDELLKNNHNRNWKGFQEHQMCAGKLAGGIDSCQGDSGGPLQVKMDLPKNLTDEQGQMHYVIGVISFGIGCARQNLPGIYTRVSPFIEWIEDNVWKNGHNKTFVKVPAFNV